LSVASGSLTGLSGRNRRGCIQRVMNIGRLATVIGGVGIVVGLVGLCSRDCRHPDADLKEILVRLPPQLQVRAKKATRRADTLLRRDTFGPVYYGTLDECVQALPFTPVVIAPPRGYRLVECRTSGTHLGLFYEHRKHKARVTIAMEQPALPLDLFNRQEVRPGWALWRNQGDKPPIAGDDWERIVWATIPDGKKGHGVELYLHGDAHVKAPTDAEMEELIRSLHCAS
jgi:hypothetical protein